jgi:isovaleryl-CoA dehydrogenase
MDLWRKMGELGVLGITVPEEYGGANMGYLAHMIAMEEISRASASVGLSYGAHSNLCVNQIKRNGSEAAAQVPAQADQRRACRRAGDERARRRLRRHQHEAQGRGQGRLLPAQRQQDVDHQRPRRRHLVVYAKTEPELGARGVTAFLIEKGMKGFSIAQKLDKLGMRGSHTGELVFRTSRCRPRTCWARSTAAPRC